MHAFVDDPMTWTGHSVSDLVRGHARALADEPAYLEPNRTTTWSQYDRAADAVRDSLWTLGDIEVAAVHLPDTADFHATLVGAYRAGVLVAAIGARSGVGELAHIARASGATVLITALENRGMPTAALVDELRGHGFEPEHVIVVDCGEVQVLTDYETSAPMQRRVFGVDDVSMLNSTSGTTGTPKLVTQTQRRWSTFAAIACRNAEMHADDVIASFVPAPFGFGLWTAHFLPALLGRPAVVMGRFDADEAIEMMAQHRVTILGAVSTQFRMMLQASRSDLSTVTSLRAMFTGGEAVPRAEAERFEKVTGAKVLQFYGSNETGAASATTVRDDNETRLSTSGHVIDEMHVRVFDGGRQATGPGVRRGQPAVKGPLASRGYYGDHEANADLFTDDGWILLGDVVEIDESGRLTVVGRLADIIIRGGKNISAVEVEDHVREHPSVAMVAAVGVPDEVFGERLCAVVTLVAGCDGLSLDELTEWLRAQGATREYLPERLVVVGEMPMAPGGKIAKAVVRGLVAGSSGVAPRVR